MAKFDPEFYDEDKKYNVSIFVGELRVPFMATRKELNGIFRLHSRPKWLRPRNFGITSEDGLLLYKVDLTKVILIEARETVSSMLNQNQEASTDGSERSEP